MDPILNDEVVAKNQSRYSLVVAAAKRARQLLSGAMPLVDAKNSKPVTVALKEIKQGKVNWVQTKEGIK
ncbi:MAG: DNA-directed RNA polymerase subunit omega [Firmicutes bacterium]|nr:DNA-directed RNA polymerase subunit omega [Bacillota bacterium]